MSSDSPACGDIGGVRWSAHSRRKPECGALAVRTFLWRSRRRGLQRERFQHVCASCPAPTPPYEGSSSGWVEFRTVDLPALDVMSE